MHTMMEVAKNRVVSFRYLMKDSKGTVLENTLARQPASYLHGASGIQPLLQAQLEGLQAGDKATVFLDAAAGLTMEDFIFEMIIDHVRDAMDEEIILGYPVQVNMPLCGLDCDCYKPAI